MRSFPELRVSCCLEYSKRTTLHWRCEQTPDPRHVPTVTTASGAIPDLQQSLRRCCPFSCLGNGGFRLYVAAAGISDDTRQRDTFQYVAGKDIQQLVPTLANTGNDLDGLITAAADYFQSKQSPSMARFHFRQVTQQPGETLDTFYTRLLASATTCSFADDAQKNVALCDQIVAGCTSDPLRRKLLETGSLDLAKALKAARAFEASVEQTTAFRRTQDSINALRHQPPFYKRTQPPPATVSTPSRRPMQSSPHPAANSYHQPPAPVATSRSRPAGIQHIALLPLWRARPP